MEPSDELLQVLQDKLDVPSGDLVCLHRDIVKMVIERIKFLNQHLGIAMYQVDRSTVLLAKVMLRSGDFTQEQYDNAIEASLKARESILEAFGLSAIEGPPNSEGTGN